MTLIRYSGRLLRRRRYGNKLARSLKCCCLKRPHCNIFGTDNPFDLSMVNDAVGGDPVNLFGGEANPFTVIWEGTFNSPLCLPPTPEDWGVELRCSHSGALWELVFLNSSPFGGMYTFEMIEFHPGGGPGSLTDPPYLIFEGTLADCGFFRFKITRPSPP